MDTSTFLNKIVASENLHARWLNTLSFLEYIGARKIIKSQQAERLTVTLLQHAAEESRHALFFKKQALKFANGYCTTYHNDHLLCGPEAEAYFQDLDKSCMTALSEADQIQNLACIQNQYQSQSQNQYENQNENQSQKLTTLTYLYVTWLVEQRATALYRLYQGILQERGLPVNLQGLLQEEDRHLAEVESLLHELDPLHQSRLIDLQLVESRLFDRYLTKAGASVSEFNQEMCENNTHEYDAHENDTPRNGAHRNGANENDTHVSQALF